MECWSSPQPVAYPHALEIMEERAQAIHDHQKAGLLWFLEHDAIYTAGTSAKTADLLDPRYPVYKTGRGGQFTYHGPGQRIVYVMMDVKKWRADVRLFVKALEEWIILSLAALGVEGHRRPGQTGIWVTPDPVPNPRADKIAAIGVRLKHWVSLHGISINHAPDLSAYQGIVPCGIDQDGLGVTSLHSLGCRASLSDLDQALRANFQPAFNQILSKSRQ